MYLLNQTNQTFYSVEGWGLNIENSKQPLIYANQEVVDILVERGVKLTKLEEPPKFDGRYSVSAIGAWKSLGNKEMCITKQLMILPYTEPQFVKYILDENLEAKPHVDIR